MISVQFSSDSAPPWRSPHFFNCALWRHNKPTCNHELTRLYVSTCLELQIIINRHHKYASIVWFSSTNYRCAIQLCLVPCPIGIQGRDEPWLHSINQFNTNNHFLYVHCFYVQTYAELSELNKCTGLITVPRLYIQYRTHVRTFAYNKDTEM